ncbi:hypothetical protein GGR51DRAFT_528472, partial [Nemania sp. FL0031]
MLFAIMSCFDIWTPPNLSIFTSIPSFYDCLLCWAYVIRHSTFLLAACLLSSYTLAEPLIVFALSR